MSRARVGPIVTIVIVAGVALILLLNREPSRTPAQGSASAPRDVPADPVGGEETPIGEDVIKNHMLVAAVWLPSVAMAGMPDPSDDVIHLEADIHAMADNPNGFAKDEFIPYMKVRYEILPAEGGKPLQFGDFLPMVAADGLHYGANVLKPPPGHYRLIYKIDPPALGRHVGAGGVAPWWEPFEASFDWTMEPPRRAVGPK
ncbi:MAG TPA: iron transporter [Isosphaeraceae bacterium]|jgi:hypothetical protein